MDELSRTVDLSERKQQMTTHTASVLGRGLTYLELIGPGGSPRRSRPKSILSTTPQKALQQPPGRSMAVDGASCRADRSRIMVSSKHTPNRGHGHHMSVAAERYAAAWFADGGLPLERGRGSHRELMSEHREFSPRQRVSQSEMTDKDHATSPDLLKPKSISNAICI